MRCAIRTTIKLAIHEMNEAVVEACKKMSAIVRSLAFPGMTSNVGSEKLE